MRFCLAMCRNDSVHNFPLLLGSASKEKGFAFGWKALHPPMFEMTTNESDKYLWLCAYRKCFFRKGYPVPIGACPYPPK